MPPLLMGGLLGGGSQVTAKTILPFPTPLAEPAFNDSINWLGFSRRKQSRATGFWPMQSSFSGFGAPSLSNILTVKPDPIKSCSAPTST